MWVSIGKKENKIKVIYWPPISKLNPNEVDVEVRLIKELPRVTCQHVSWPPIKVKVCLRWPSLAPSQGRHNRGREVLPYCCQSRSSTEHMKGLHSSFYGPRWLHKPLLCSEFMCPVARINNVSLIRDPRDRDPWREGSRGESNRVQCVPWLCRAPPQIIIRKNIFIGKNLFHSFIKDVPQYIFQRGVIAEASLKR